MSATGRIYRSLRLLNRIWKELPGDKACELYDKWDVDVSDVRNAAGAPAADHYYNWILRSLLA